MIEYTNLATKPYGEFDEWSGRRPRSWFKKNLSRFYFEIEEVDAIKKPYDQPAPDGPGIYFLYTHFSLQYYKIEPVTY
jgi:hypothetical protein